MRVIKIVTCATWTNKQGKLTTMHCKTRWQSIICKEHLDNRTDACDDLCINKWFNAIKLNKQKPIYPFHWAAKPCVAPPYIKQTLGIFITERSTWPPLLAWTTNQNWVRVTRGIADGLGTKYQYDINSFIVEKSTEISHITWNGICINTFFEEVSVKSN